MSLPYLRWVKNTASFVLFLVSAIEARQAQRTHPFAGWQVFQRLRTNSPCFAAGAVRRGDLCGGEKRRLRGGAPVRAS